MSNVHPGLQCLTGGFVDHSSCVSRDIGFLFLNDNFSDITLNVSGHKFMCHKVILAARSDYFRALLYGGMKESQQNEIEIVDGSVNSFRILLKYIYCGVINLGTEKDETVQEILGLAHQYGFLELETAICEYLKDSLTTNNVCHIYDLSSLYSLDNLKSVCGEFMDKNASDILNHPSFNFLSPNALKLLIQRDSFCALELEIFQGIKSWYENNPKTEEDVVKEILTFIRLPLISLPDLLNKVRPTNLISPDQILDAIKSKNESRDTELKYRGYLMPAENVATNEKEAIVLTGEMRDNLLDGKNDCYDMDKGFARHPIDDNNGQGIVIRLGRQCIINYMKMLLWDKDHRAYSYTIEISMDQNDWVRVIDHRRFNCRSWQFLHFEPRVAKYIRIVGTNNTINRVFHVVSFEAYFVKENVNLKDGLIVPTENVALVSKSAKVIEGVSRARNNLLNCDINHYNWDSGYTCHQLGSGCICIQLGQPYILSSCKLLLWDCDDRTYSYYVESSINGREWDMVVDKTHEPCRAWQHIVFKPTPIVYFRIVGTFNSANEVFHLVHFEAPAQNHLWNSAGNNSFSDADDVTDLRGSPRSPMSPNDRISPNGPHLSPNNSSRFAEGIPSTSRRSPNCSVILVSPNRAKGTLDMGSPSHSEERQIEPTIRIPTPDYNEPALANVIVRNGNRAGAVGGWVGPSHPALDDEVMEIGRVSRSSSISDE